MFANQEIQKVKGWQHEGLTETMTLKFKDP